MTHASEDPRPRSLAVDIGSTARDTARERVGRVMAYEGGRMWLRPLGGGCEWAASPEDVEPVTLSESLGPLVAEANRRSTEPR
ncbi:hypothetical protein [Streptomyces sp. NPDC127098]|uniref:hypothetical protein n=1 Tax=Streptomyces sp. NPDC127098 TaxID=3347137 RepID=UPI003652C183